MPDGNTDFVGSIPEYYDKYLGPLIFEEYSKDIAILPRTIKTDSADNAPKGFILGNPLSLQIPKLGGDLDEVMAKVAQNITAEFGKPPIEASMQAIVFKAHKRV